MPQQTPQQIQQFLNNGIPSFMTGAGAEINNLGNSVFRHILPAKIEQPYETATNAMNSQAQQVSPAAYSSGQTAAKIGEGIVGAEGGEALAAPLVGALGLTGLPAATLTGAAAGVGGMGLPSPNPGGLSRLQNMGVGTAMGVATPLVAPVLSKGIGAVKSILPSVDPTLASLAAQNPNLRMTVGELTQSPVIQKAEKFLENIPGVGMWKFRQTQANAAKEAAQDLANQYANGLHGVSDAQSAAQDSYLNQVGAANAKAGELYGNFRKLAASNPIPMPTPNLRSAAQAILDEQGNLPESLQASKPVNIAKGILDQPNQPISNAIALRPALGDEISNSYRRWLGGNATKNEGRYFSMLKSGLDQDLGEFGNQNSLNENIGDAFNTANDYYKNNVAPLQDNMLRKMQGEKFDSDKLLQTYIKPNQPQLAQKFMASLDPDGQQAVRYGFLQNILDKATRVGNNNNVSFSAATAANNLEKHGSTLDQLFQPDQLQQVRGLFKILQASPQMSRYMENPPTGNRLVQSLLHFGGLGEAGLAIAKPAIALGSAKVAVPAWGGAKLATKYLTDWGPRQILAKAATTDGPETLSALGASLAKMLKNGVPLETGAWQALPQKQPALQQPQ